MPRRVIVLVVLTLVVCAACTRGNGRRERIYALTLVKQYGALELNSDSLDLPVQVRRAGGDVLGAFRGAVQAMDSTVYVLDRHWYKIVGFRPDGSLKEVIRGGYGDGPGEFRLPVHLGMMQNGDLVVLDYELQRLNFFRPGDGFISSARLDIPGPLRLLPAGDTLWITQALFPGSTGPRAIAVDRQGKRIGEGPPVTESEKPFGSPVNLTRMKDGELLLPLMRPGLWEVFHSGGGRVHGQELFPDLAPPLVKQEGRNTSIGSSEAWTTAAAVLRDRMILIWYNTASLDERGFAVRESIRNGFAVFDATGNKLGTASLPPGINPYPWSLSVSPLTGHLLLGAHEPYPTVLEMRLDEVAK